MRSLPHSRVFNTRTRARDCYAPSLLLHAHAHAHARAPPVRRTPRRYPEPVHGADGNVTGHCYSGTTAITFAFSFSGFLCAPLLLAARTPVSRSRTTRLRWWAGACLVVVVVVVVLVLASTPGGDGQLETSAGTGTDRQTRGHRFTCTGATLTPRLQLPCRPPNRYSTLVLTILKEGSAVLFALTIAATLPLSDLAFGIPALMHAVGLPVSSFSAYNAGGLVLVLVGFLAYTLRSADATGSGGGDGDDDDDACLDPGRGDGGGVQLLRSPHTHHTAAAIN